MDELEWNYGRIQSEVDEHCKYTVQGIMRCMSQQSALMLMSRLHDDLSQQLAAMTQERDTLRQQRAMWKRTAKAKWQHWRSVSRSLAHGAETVNILCEQIEADSAHINRLSIEVEEAHRERDAAIYTLMQRNPDALAGEIVQWVRDAKAELETLRARIAELEHDTAKEELTAVLAWLSLAATAVTMITASDTRR